MKISIITPCRNSVKTIQRTMDSVLTQELTHELEYIIIDGDSNDGTLEVIEDYSKKYDCIKYISEKDKSMTEALNKGMRKASGDIVASINADDAYLPGTLEKVCKQFENEEENIILINTYFVKERGNIKSHNTPRYFSPLICGLIECPFPECAIFFRKKCIVAMDYFNEEYRYTQDLELYLRLYNSGYKFSYIDIEGSCFFISDTNYSTTVSEQMRKEVYTYIKYKNLYKYISGSNISKLIKVLLRIRHYYIFKHISYTKLCERYCET